MCCTQDLPKWIGWFHYLDFLHYAWASLMLNEFGERPTNFLGNQTVRIKWSGPKGSCPLSVHTISYHGKTQ